jgi:TetR/AcrR family transcriptional regulator
MQVDRNKKAEIREENEQLILRCAEHIFAQYGFNGSTTRQIAERAGLPKANIHYYFDTKSSLYQHVLESMLSDWMMAAKTFETNDDPATVLCSYIEAKMDLARRRPYGSRVWAREIMSGAPVMEKFLATTLKKWADERIAIIDHWVENRKIKPIDPSALLYMIWATTQHYADFDRQIVILNGGKALSERDFVLKKQQVTALILASVGLD